MTTHLTNDALGSDEEEPELLIIDDDEFEAAHRIDEEPDGLEDGDEFEFSFEEDLDEAIALDVSDDMDPTVEEADERMAPLFIAQREAPSEEPDEHAGTAMPVAAAVVAAAPTLSKQEAKAEEKRQREILKRRNEMDKAARQDEKERQREERAQAAAAERRAEKEEAEAAKREAAEAKKRAAGEKKQAAEAKRQEAANAKSAAVEAKRAAGETKNIPAGLTSFVRDESPDPAEARTRKDARAEKREGTKRSLLVVVVVILLVVVGIAGYAMTRPKANAGAGTGAAHAKTGSNALPAALAATVSANTADVAYALDISGSHPASINGGGSVDLATQGSNLSLTYSLGGQSFPEQIVYDGGQAFYDLGAIVHYVTPGYDWVSMDLAPGGSGVPGIGVGGVLADPSALVSLLGASASFADEVGHVAVDGAPATEYSISLGTAALTRVLASAGLPSFVHGAAYTRLDEQAYVNGTGHVSRIVAVGTYPDSGQTVTASTTLDLSHYGTPVSVAPPPPPQVVSEQQFEANAARLAHAPTP